MDTEIATPRLILRSLKNEDAAVVTQACQDSWDDLKSWMRWTDEQQHSPSHDETQKYIANCRKNFTEENDFTFGGFLREGNELALITRLHPKNKKIGYICFGGYWTRKKYQGQGLMAEAVNAMIQFGFDKLKARRLEIVVADTNHKSIAVIKKSGFQEEARLKIAHHLPGGRVADELVFVRFNKENLPSLNISMRDLT